jgi:hypothetical protein
MEILSVTPNNSTRGSTLDLIIIGSGFETAAQISFSGEGININRTGIEKGTTFHANISISSEAELGTRDITITQGEEVFTLPDAFSIEDVGAQYRFPLELLPSPFNIDLNPGEVYDHSGVYLYRILPKPVDVWVTFDVSGPSFVEVLDADNNRWLLDEKTAIDETTSFKIEWDGVGVLEPRVWKDSQVKGCWIEFFLSEDEEISEMPAQSSNALPWVVFCGGLVGGGIGVVSKIKRKKK